MVRLPRLELLVYLNFRILVEKRICSVFNPVQVLIERKQDGYYTGYTNQYHPCKILSDAPLSGRITIEWERIEEGTYYGKKDVVCD